MPSPIHTGHRRHALPMVAALLVSLVPRADGFARLPGITKIAAPHQRRPPASTHRGNPLTPHQRRPARGQKVRQTIQVRPQPLKGTLGMWPRVMNRAPLAHRHPSARPTAARACRGVCGARYPSVRRRHEPELEGGHSVRPGYLWLLFHLHYCTRGCSLENRVSKCYTT